jgi:hypothetical protein
LARCIFVRQYPTGLTLLTGMSSCQVEFCPRPCCAFPSSSGRRPYDVLACDYTIARCFCGTKTLGWQNLVFWAQNQQRTHHKVGTTRPPKANHTAIYAEGACPYTHRATDSRTLSVRGCLGGRSAWGVQGSSAEGRPYVLHQAYGTKDKNC